MKKTFELAWDLSLPPLPAKNGQPHLGLAGSFSGTFTTKDGPILMIAGGTNFPSQSLLDSITLGETPQKRYQGDIFLLEKSQANPLRWQWRKSKTSMPQGMAHGASVNTPDGILIFGGEVQISDKRVEASSSIWKLTLVDNEVHIETLGLMPVTFSYGACCHHSGKVYLSAGIQNGKASNRVHVYDIASNSWSELPEYPGSARTELVSTVGVDKNKIPHLYLFSGATSNQQGTVASDDYLKINLQKPVMWTNGERLLVNTDSQPLSLLGASCIAISDRYSIFFGGYNKQVFDAWLIKIQSTASTREQRKAKIQFFSQPADKFNWNKTAFAFDSKYDNWHALNELPFEPNCGASIERIANDIFLFSGEIKPGVRSPKIRRATFQQMSVS